MFDDGVYGMSFESLAPSDTGDEPNSRFSCERQISLTHPDFRCSNAPDSATARGEALAVLRGGLILGSDPHGGVFRGCYRYDAARDETFVEVRLSIPPNGILLTGLEVGPEGAVVDVSGRFRAATSVSPHSVSSAVVHVAGAPVKVELRFVGAL